MAESWTPKDDYSPSNHDHDSKYSKLGHTHAGIGDLPDHNHDTLYSKIGHNHDERFYTETEVDAKLKTLKDEILAAGIDILPIGTIMWFKQSVTLSDKWQVYEPLIGRYPLGATSGLGDTVEAGLPNITGEIKGHAAGTDGAYGGTFRGVHQSGASLDDLTTGSFVVGDKAGGSSGMAYTADSDTYTLKFDASVSSSVYKDDCDTVTPPYTKLIPYVKIA